MSSKEASRLFKALDDTIRIVVVNQVYRSEGLESTDSIFIWGNYLPQTNVKCDSEGDLVYRNKFKYNKGRTSLNLGARKTGFSSGSLRVYDEGNRYLLYN